MSLRLFHFIGPLICLFLIFIVDRGSSLIWGDQTLAPLLSVLSLFGLAMMVGPLQILGWLPLFAAESYWMIEGSSQYPFTRTSTVILAGLMAAWAARQRIRAKDQNLEIERILESLPVPWALIDSKGSVLKANALAASLFRSSPENMAGLSIFDVGADEETRQLRLQNFVKTIETSQSAASLDFQIGKVAGSEKKISARVLRIPSRRGNDLLLTLNDSS